MLAGHTVVTMFQVLLRDQWADAVVWPLVEQDTTAILKPPTPKVESSSTEIGLDI